MSNELGHVATLLCAAGFKYEGQIPAEEFLLHPAEEYEDLEEYLGWEIQSYPVFVVIHRSTGHTWKPLFDSLEDVERVKFLIRKGVEVDLEIAMGVGR